MVFEFAETALTLPEGRVPQKLWETVDAVDPDNGDSYKLQRVSSTCGEMYFLMRHLLATKLKRHNRNLCSAGSLYPERKSLEEAVLSRYHKMVEAEGNECFLFPVATGGSLFEWFKQNKTENGGGSSVYSEFIFSSARNGHASHQADASNCLVCALGRASDAGHIA